MTTKRLQAAEAAYKQAQEEAERARVARNEAVVEALGEGTKAAEVARVTGLGKARIGQIKAAAQS